MVTILLFSNYATENSDYELLLNFILLDELSWLAFYPHYSNKDGILIAEIPVWYLMF